LKSVNNYGCFFHGGHHVHWLKISEIKEGKFGVAPNILFLISECGI